MSKNDDKPGVLHSFLGGLIFTILLVVIIPMLTAYFIEPHITETIGDIGLEPYISAGTLVTAAMLLVLIIFLILLGGGKIFKKYGVIGVIGLIVAYWLLENIEGAILPIAVILLFVAISYIRGK